MKRLTALFITTLVLVLVTTIALSAHNMTVAPVRLDEDVDYLPTSIDGFARIVSADTSVNIVNLSEKESAGLPEINRVRINQPCTEILPTISEFYHRVISRDGIVALVHVNDLDNYCSRSDASTVLSGLNPCDTFEAYIPTSNEDYFRLLMKDGSVYLIERDKMADYCNRTS